MTLSLHPSTTPWDRTLPKPSALVAIGAREIDFHHGLLHHRVGSKQWLNGEDSFVQENGKRDSIRPDQTTHVSHQVDPHATINGVTTDYLQVGAESSRQRTTSIMSTGDTSRSSSPASTSPAEGSGICLCQKEPKIPRPRNAFILFRQHHHAAVVAQHPGLPNPDISKIIGEQWRQLPDQAKEEWKLLAEDEKVRHSQQYPDYRYKPRRSGRLGGISSSISGPASATSETPATCQKCGGKSLNPPQPLSTVTTTGISGVPPMATRMTGAQHLLSPPHSVPTRQYLDVYGRPIAAPFDPRLQHASVLQGPVQMTEGPESKKRRFNGDPAYPMARPVYVEQGYQRSPHERKASDAMVTGQFHRSNMGPPARTGHPVQMQPNRSSHTQQHRRDLSLTLPPLKTPLSQQVSTSFTSGPHSQRSGVEAMILSIPVLNKVKILSQIAPSLMTPGPASPPREVRGAIVAVEGMDSTSVYNMTNTLAEQLEKDGKFAVRIFGGPDPYAILASSSRASNGEGKYLDVSGFLDLISRWHKISKEMQDYITKRPRIGEETPDDVIMEDATHSAHPRLESQRNHRTQGEQPKTPTSAVSPKTIVHTADLSLKSPSEPTIKKTQTNENEGASHTTQRKSRIPASAMVQAKAQAEVDAEMPSPLTSSTPRPNISQAVQQQQQPPPPHDEIRQSTLVDSAATSNSQLIPIAIVPHYQLTTVDSSSIAMPITDAYSPHSHWQWLATLWRGCLGPDVTVIIQAGDPVEDGHTTTNNEVPATAGPSRTMSQSSVGVPPSQQQQQQQQQPPVFGSLMNTTQRLSQPQNPHYPSQQAAVIHRQSQQPQQQQQQQQQKQQDVEVRLLDCRAVVVRAPSKGARTSSGGSGGGNEWEGTEWWEKAKRRVGFEVEEFLRR